MTTRLEGLVEQLRRGKIDRRTFIVRAIALGVPSYHIERTEDIEDDWLADADIVGVTAGASTPDDVIEAVVADLTNRGYAPPEHGIRPIDAEYVPSY